MKPIYADIKSIGGLHRAGICTVLITPREWLATDPIRDFTTGVVMQPIQLKPGRYWMYMSLVRSSFFLTESPKDSKAGNYYEIRAGGTLNIANAAIQAALETIATSELVVLIQDVNRKRKLIGDANTAMKLSITHTHLNNPSREERIDIELANESEHLAPYYNPDNTPEIFGNYLVNDDGNYLLVE